VAPVQHIQASSPRQNSSQRYCLNSCFALYICLQLHLKARISFTPAAGMDAIQSNFCLRACGRRKKNMTNARKYQTTFFVDVVGPCLIHGIFAPRGWVPAWYAYAGAFTVFPFVANKRWSQHNVLSLTKNQRLKKLDMPSPLTGQSNRATLVRSICPRIRHQNRTTSSSSSSSFSSSRSSSRSSSC
jgi:hypothetical protein